jgi:hypothetical protein
MFLFALLHASYLDGADNLADMSEHASSFDFHFSYPWQLLKGAY